MNLQAHPHPNFREIVAITSHSHVCCPHATASSLSSIITCCPRLYTRAHDYFHRYESSKHSTHWDWEYKHSTTSVLVLLNVAWSDLRIAAGCVKHLLKYFAVFLASLFYSNDQSCSRYLGYTAKSIAIPAVLLWLLSSFPREYSNILSAVSAVIPQSPSSCHSLFPSPFSPNPQNPASSGTQSHGWNSYMYFDLFRK